jgi:ubiquinone/menaquinone biosynthesis C-methylase UbiE
MGLGRRKVSIEDASAWVFNRIADVYDARPDYPAALIDALADLAGRAGSRVADLGAGIGHVALPLCARGVDVVAVEPARAMLDRLRRAAEDRGLALRTVHGAAERLPFERASVDLVIIADALHFMDAQLIGAEIDRVLAPGGRLAVVTCQPAPTPFMRDLVRVIEQAVPRRPRALTQNMVHVTGMTGVALAHEQQFDDHTPVDLVTLDRILRSVSFIGPAMNPQRLLAFRQAVFALSEAPVWARTFVLRSGRRAVRAAPRERGPAPTCSTS